MKRHQGKVVHAGLDPGADLTEDEVEFGAAMEAYKRLRKRPFPTCSEVLEVLKSLGYRRAAEGQYGAEGGCRAGSLARTGGGDCRPPVFEGGGGI